MVQTIFLAAGLVFTTHSFSRAGEEDHDVTDGLLAEAIALLPSESVTARPPESLTTDDSLRGALGEWSEIIPWPHIPVTAANLPDGRLVTWAASRRTSFPGGDPEFTYAAVYDPATQEITEINNTEHNMFCGHPSMLASGYAVVAGGRNHVRRSSYFDYLTNQWVRVEDMNDTRWYPSSTALPDGNMIIASGNNGTGINTVERYIPGAGWHRLSSVDWTPVATKPFPYNFVAPDGRIISAGPTGRMFWLDTEANGGAGELPPTSAVFPGNRIHQSGGIGMYNEGKIIFAGGGVSGGTTTIAHTLDINGPEPVVTAIAPLHKKRRMHNGLMLPNGDFIVLGGNASGIQFSDAGTVYEPEVWNPDTDTWTEMAPASVPRNYHSVALMLPDGRLLSGGGGLSGNTATNHQDVQFFSPSYLFDENGTPAPRPSITSAQDAAGAGQNIAVVASPDIQRFTMIRMTATTHAFSSDVRFLEVPFTTRQPGRYDLRLHANPNVLLPGYWMLFALNGNGTPSIAKILKIHIPSKPVLASPGNQNHAVGTPVDISLVASDEDGDPLLFSATHLPVGISINAQSGRITGAAQAAGVATVELRVTDGRNTVSKTIQWEILPLVGVNAPPVLANPGPQVSAPNRWTELAIQASDPNSDTILYSAVNLPAGLAIDPASGVITGTPTAPGTRTVSISAADDSASTTVTFEWIVRQKLVATPLTPGPQRAGAAHVFTVSAIGENLTYTWNFGDGSSPGTTSSGAVNHTYSQPGRYTITVDIADDSGQSTQVSYRQVIHPIATAHSPAISQSILYEQRAGAHDRVWNVNPDNDSVTVIDATSRLLLTTIAVGDSPRSLALTRNGHVWVTNKKSASISIIDTATLSVLATIPLPPGSAPHGIVMSPAKDEVFVALENTGEIAKFSSATLSILSTAAAGKTPRHLSINSEGTTIYVSQFVTSPVTGEATASPTPGPDDGGKVMALDSASLSATATVTLGLSTLPDGATEGRGIPNYIGPAAISPDGTTAWVASKQDNVQRGSGRDGNPLNFEHTVRSISSPIDLRTNIAHTSQRAHHDNAGVAVTSIFGGWGNFVLVALEGSRSVAVMDAYTGQQVTRFETGRAPQGLALAPDGRSLFVHNYMERSVSVHDLSQVIDGTGEAVPALSKIATVPVDALAPAVLRGKQLFYDSRDERLALQEYISCAACHNDGSHDGRVWDLTGFGEGLRNTIDLRGRGGIGHGALHWSANFDEVQDFEGQIRNLSGGTGLLEGSPHPSLGSPNGGLDADLDALAAYVTSLDSFERSPYRNRDGSLTAQGAAGREVFRAQGCADCHSGERFTDSDAAVLHDIGTLTAASGNRLGGILRGIDTPTLRGLWDGAPYLHDGSAPTLQDAVNAHSGISISGVQLQQLTSYLQQIDDLEPGAPDTTSLPPAADEHIVTPDVIALYHFNGNYADESANRLTLIPSGGVQRTAANTGWMQRPAGQVARFSAVGDTLTLSIPDALVTPEMDSSLTMEARVFVRNYLGWGVENLPIVFLHQEWDSHYGLQDRKWGDPRGANIMANAQEVLTAQQVNSLMSPGQWHHLQISYDGASEIKTWIDGALVARVDKPPHPSRTNDWTLTLGNFDGDVDEVILRRSVVPQPPTAPDIYPSTWTAWLNSSLSSATSSPTTNADGDYFVDLLEYALGNDPRSGISASTFALEKQGANDSVTAIYDRPTSVSDIEYSIEISKDRVQWQTVAPSSRTQHSDGTESVRTASLDAFPGFAEGGFARLAVRLNGTGLRAVTPEFAWLRTPLHTGYQTIGISTVRAPVFASTVGGTNGTTITWSGGENFAAVFDGTTPAYIEMRGGSLEGQRIDIDLDRTSRDSIGLDLASPFNTLHQFPSSAVGAPFAVHLHRTVDDIFTKDSFTGTTSPATSDRIHFYTGGAVAYDSYFLLDGGIDSPYYQWTSLSNASLEDSGNRIVAPGTGVFLQRPTGSPASLFTQVGMVRQNLFRQPLNEGYNLIAAGYPIAQSPVQRQATLARGFLGDLDPAAADQIQIWRGDSGPDQSGYDSYFLLDAGVGSPYRYWTTMDTTTLHNFDDVPLFHPARAAFLLLVESPLPAYSYDDQ
ncbi:MAG: putative Ig domain-containing protein [Verrucomicrobiales bacterium]